MKFPVLFFAVFSLASCAQEKADNAPQRDTITIPKHDTALIIQHDTIVAQPPQTVENKPGNPEPQEVAGPTAKELITPGKSIGSIVLGQTQQSVLAELGTPDSGDAAMGHSWTTWLSKDGGKNELNIFSGLGPDGKIHVRHIRVTSPFFKTEKGISTKNLLKEILVAYPDARKLKSKNGIEVYDDVARGIAFEVFKKNGVCRAITVHPAGEKVTNEYIPLDR